MIKCSPQQEYIHEIKSIQMLSMHHTRTQIGIIGGSGFDDPQILEGRREVYGETPYGAPSDVLVEGRISGVDCVLLARHGRRHSIMPSNINYRANIYALKKAGCTHILASTATGSLQEDIKPGQIIVLDNFIDRTTKRQQTFYDGKEHSPVGVCHMSMEPAFCTRTRDAIIRTALEIGIPAHDRGTAITIEGPRFSSRAESLMFRQWGADVVNMTTVPEVALAKEAGLCYAAIAMATDFDSWTSSSTVSVADVLVMFKANVEKITQLIIGTVANIAKEDWTETLEAMQKDINDSVMLPHD